MILQVPRPIPVPPIAWEKIPDDYVLPNAPVDNTTNWQLWMMMDAISFLK